VHLAEAVGFAPQQPAPIHAYLLNLRQFIFFQKAGAVRIVVQYAEDALAISHRLPDLAQIKGRAVILCSMNLRQIIGEGLHPIIVQIGCPILFDPLQVEEVLLALDLLHEQEVFPGLPCRDQLAFLGEVAHIQGPDVPGKMIKGGILPDHYPGPIGEVIVAEAVLYSHGGEDGRALFAFGLILHQ